LWLIPLLPLLAWGFFCKSVNGHFLPNTYYLKSRPFHFGRAEVSLAWSSICDGGLVPWWAYLVGLAAFVATCVKRMDQRKWITLGVFVAAPVIYLVAVFGTRQILLQGYYWTRWLDPALLALAVPASVGYGALIRWAGASRRLLGKETGPGTSLTLVTAVIGVIGIGCLAASIPPYAHSFSDRRSHLASDARAIDLLNVRAGKWINEHTPHDATIVVTDAGGTRYFGMRRTIDLVGLNNAAIAFHRLDARDAIRNADWLAICPALFSGSDLQRYIAAEFTPRIEIRIPPAEYTICNNPWQAVIEILERNPKPAMPGSR
ncbi:MAG TPA: hypothetical protein VMU02_01350, partial [bacterium]|nr:hypothetical protein [bacterium]